MTKWWQQILQNNLENPKPRPIGVVAENGAQVMDLRGGEKGLERWRREAWTAESENPWGW